jgi:hypothetical protein
MSRAGDGSAEMTAVTTPSAVDMWAASASHHRVDGNLRSIT